MSDFFAQATQSFLQPILPYLNDPEVTEVMVNGPHTIYIEKRGRLYRTPSQFKDEDELMAAIRRIGQMVGKRVDTANPIMDARLPDGSRVHVIIPPSARVGPCLSIRKFSRDTLGMRQLVEMGAMSLAMAKFLNLCVVCAKNIIVSGGTSSGKTTLLNIISALIPKDQRILVIEDASELQLQQEHVVAMETQPTDAEGKGGVTIRDLVRASLRMRPDRIVIGEVRGPEAMDLLQAMNTGHAGSMATLHANTARGALDRLETLAMMSDVALPWRALRNQVSLAVDVIVQVGRIRGGARRITSITEVLGCDEQGQYKMSDIFLFRMAEGKDNQIASEGHQATGCLPSFLQQAKDQGFLVDETLFATKDN